MHVWRLLICMRLSRLITYVSGRHRPTMVDGNAGRDSGSVELMDPASGYESDQAGCLRFGRYEQVLYTWGAEDGNGRGVCGVSRSGTEASRRLNEAIDGLAPGALGSIRRTRLDQYACQPSYVHGVVLMRVRRDKDTAELIISEPFSIDLSDRERAVRDHA
jgi:hypothetical protein